MRYITVHASATYPDMDVDVNWIRNIHVNENGWSDIGYHYFIKRNGDIQKGREKHRTGAHVKNFNTGNLGICMAGGLQRGTNAPEDNFTDKQYQSLNKLLHKLHQEYPEALIKGHNEFRGHSSRGCPCFDISGYREWLSKTWKSLYLPNDWWKHDWKEGIVKDWNETNIYKEMPIKHMDWK